MDHIFNLSLRVVREKIARALARAGISNKDKLKVSGNLALSGLRVKQLDLLSQSDTAKQVSARCLCSVVLGSSQLS